MSDEQLHVAFPQMLPDGQADVWCICGFTSVPMSPRYAQFFALVHQEGTDDPRILLGLKALPMELERMT